MSGAARAQTLFAASESENALYAINPTTGAASVVLGGGSLAAPQGLAYYAPTGDLFIANSGEVVVGTPNGSIVQYNTRTGSTSIFYAGNAGLDSPQGLTFDASGNLYATGYNSGTIVQFARTGGTLSTTATSFATGLNFPYYLASDAAGGLFVANTSDGNIRRYSAANTFTTFSASGSSLAAPIGLAFGGTTLFSSDAANNTIVGFNNASGDTSTRTNPDFTITPTGASALNNPQALAYNPFANSLYIANIGGNNIVRYNASTGVSDVLFMGGVAFTPTGLVFATDTPEPSTGLLALGGLTSAGSISVLARRTKKRRAGVKKTA